MPWQFGRHNRRAFQDFFYSMEFHLAESYRLNDLIYKQDKSHPEKMDRKLWMNEKAEGRACLIAGIAGIETLSNHLLKTFSKRTIDDLPRDLLSKRLRSKPISWWSLIDKVYFLPTLCNASLLAPESYFKKESHDFQLFKELIELRNDIMHGKPYAKLMVIELKPGNIKIVHDDFEINFMPLSKIQKDISVFNYESAKVARDNIIWVRDSLFNFIDDLDDNYLSEEKIDLISRVISDDEADLPLLKLNWRDFLNHDVESD